MRIDYGAVDKVLNEMMDDRREWSESSYRALVVVNRQQADRILHFFKMDMRPLVKKVSSQSRCIELVTGAKIMLLCPVQRHIKGWIWAHNAAGYLLTTLFIDSYAGWHPQEGKRVSGTTWWEGVWYLTSRLRSESTRYSKFVMV